MLKVTKTIDPISSALIDGVNKCYSMLKVTFCSYFLMNIVNFYTLTLMYNFLGLPAQPIFSRIALEKLSQIFYKRNSLFSYIEDLFNLTGSVKPSNFRILWAKTKKGWRSSTTISVGLETWASLPTFPRTISRIWSS